jgi:hypothetical protein
MPPEVQALTPWPRDGVVSKTLDQKLVFRDDASGEIVVTYPAEPGVQLGTDPSMTVRREYFRFYLLNRVAPMVSTKITRNADRQYVYSYELQNCPEADNSIVAWLVAAPPRGADPSLRISHRSWYASRGTARQVLIPSVDQGYWTFLTWTKWSDPIQPGGKLDGFEVVSVYRPGLTTAFAFGAGGITVPGELTEELSNQLIPLQKPEVNWRPILAIGPRFSLEASGLEIATAFEQDLRFLIDDEWLDAQSPFFQGLLTTLRSYIESNGSRQLSIPEPRDEMEEEVAEAVRLSLLAIPNGSLRQ